MYEWRSRILSSAQRAELDVRRPGRLRMGTTMTVAILGEYRKTDADGNLDLDGTVEALRQAERVLDDALHSGS
jgi:hypothetical protein